MKSLFARKPIAVLQDDPNGLKRVLGAGDLVMLAIGAVIGAGIFGAIGTAAAGQVDAAGTVIRQPAGPALVFSFLLLGGVCALAALCYAELASMIPQAGSAYAYTYATLGELVAWIIGWDLILEYAVGNVAVAISWGDYFKTLTGAFFQLPVWLTTGYRTALLSSDPGVHGLLESAPRVAGIPILVNIPAAAIVLVNLRQIAALELGRAQEQARADGHVESVRDRQRDLPEHRAVGRNPLLLPEGDRARTGPRRQHEIAALGGFDMRGPRQPAGPAPGAVEPRLAVPQAIGARVAQEGRIRQIEPLGTDGGIELVGDIVPGHRAAQVNVDRTARSFDTQRGVAQVVVVRFGQLRGAAPRSGTIDVLAVARVEELGEPGQVAQPLLAQSTTQRPARAPQPRFVAVTSRPGVDPAGFERGVPDQP